MTTLKTLLSASTALALVAGAANAEGTIAYFASTSQNGFNQATYEGVQEVAAERGYDTEILDGQFDAAVQYSQIEDALASGRYAQAVRQAEDLWRARGITSVPAVVVEGKYLISGGQPAQVFEEALRKIASEV